jgi:UDPglucose 6-dehydrogenase
MEICVVGVGYVGLVTAACFSHTGHMVVGVDDDREKIASLRRGRVPIFERHLDQLVSQGIGEGRLRFTDDLVEGVGTSSIVFICVGTPPLESGEADLSAIEDVVRRIAQVAESRMVIVEKSTVPVQTGLWMEKALILYGGGQTGRFAVASNPEFLREGSAVEDFLHPDRIVIGVDQPEAEEVLRSLYEPVIRRRFRCPVHETCEASREVPFLVTDVVSAELIKHASNSFLATKISYINLIADLCERVGADVAKVAEGMGLDRRIGRAFLDAGIGFGGFCLPKDLQAFVRIAEKHGIELRLLKEVERINEERVDVVLRKLRQRLLVLRGKAVAVLGLSFKPDTDDIRFAPALEIIRRLRGEGTSVRAYDPQAMFKAAGVLEAVEFCRDAYEAVEGADALVVATEWEEFRRLDLFQVKRRMRQPVIIDGRNIFDRGLMESLGFEYVGMGR